MKKRNTVLIVLIVINIFLTLAVVVLGLNKMGILTRSGIRTGEYSYLTNPQYEANLTMFELVKGDADMIFAGDSITAYGRFSEFFPEQRVLNRGIGSDTTEGLYNRIDEVISHHPKKVFVMIGINDIDRNISIDESMKYYDMIISEIKKEIPECVIYAESVLPTDTIELSTIESYNTSLQELCNRKGIEYIDLYNLFMLNNTTNNNLFSADKVHLNGNGYSIWIDIVDDLLYQ